MPANNNIKTNAKSKIKELSEDELKLVAGGRKRIGGGNPGTNFSGGSFYSGGGFGNFGSSISFS